MGGPTRKLDEFSAARVTALEDRIELLERNQREWGEKIGKHIDNAELIYEAIMERFG